MLWPMIIQELCAAGWRQEEIAKEIGVTQGRISQLLDGGDLSYERAVRLVGLYKRCFPLTPLSALKNDN